jgi:hypothetical protein
LYIDGQPNATSTDAKATDQFNEPTINGNTTDNVFVRDFVFVPYQPMDAEVARWSSPGHEWLISPSGGIDQMFYISGALTAGTYPQSWISPYFFTVKNVVAYANTPPSSNLTVRILKNNATVATLVVPTAGSAELANLAVDVSAGDRARPQAEEI